MRIRYAGATHAGLARDHNEDVYMLDPAHRLFVVADGMGGREGGEIASRIAVTAIRDHFSRLAELERFPHLGEVPDPTLEAALVEAIQRANERIRRFARAQGMGRMGTTIVGAVCRDDDTIIAHVGDSRCYRIRGGTIRQLTEDHSLVSVLRRSAVITADEADSHPMRHVVLRALGPDDDVEVDVTHEHPEPGDLFLLCSDGITDTLRPETVASIAEAHRRDLRHAAWALVRHACEAGGPDDMTAVLIGYDGDGS